MSRRELVEATYRDAHGTWPARAWLEDGRFRAVIHGVLFGGCLDNFEPTLRPEVEPRAPESERGRDGGVPWRPSVVELRRVGDRYEARTPLGDHRGTVVPHDAAPMLAPADGAWPPLTVATGFCSDGSSSMVLCAGTLSFGLDVSMEPGDEDARIDVEIVFDVDVPVGRLTLRHRGGTVETSRVVQLEGALDELARALGPGRVVRACFFCQYSDYSPGGDPFSGMACYRGSKSQYLAVRSKFDLFQLRATQAVEDLWLCPEFEQRVPGHGYRGWPPGS